MDLVSRANALASRLAGPTPSSCCPGCFAYFADLLQAATARELDRVRADCHPFWDACVGVVIKALSDDEIDALGQTLDDNLDRCRRVHADTVIDENTVAEVVHGFVDTACRCLYLVLAGQGDSADERAERNRQPFATSRGFWPSSSDQLFPDGPLAALTSLVRWGKIVTSLYPIIVLTLLVRVALPFVLDTVNQSHELRASVVNLIIDRLRGRDAVEQADDLEERSPAWMARFQGIIGAAGLLNTSKWGPDSGGSDLLSVLRGREADVFAAVLAGMAFLDGMSTGKTDATYKNLANPAILLQQYLKQPVDVLPARALEYRDIPEDLPGIVSRFNLLLDLKCRRRCAGPGCGRFAHTVAPDAVFKQCAGCKKLCYCSDECQRCDWTDAADGRVPHKNICAALRKIVPGGPVNSMSYTEWKDTLDFMMAHDALLWEYRERARELRGPVVMMTFFAVGPRGAMHWNYFPDM